MLLTDFLELCTALLVLTIGASLVRIVLGPTAVDRMMGAQLAGTSGIAILLLVGATRGRSEVLDVALVLAMLAAFAVVGFAKAASPDGAGDPEEQPPS